ncbi:Fe-S protein assembly co-chaperone HscB [Zavarzinia sp.]|uniref:Fe-S protein assembly co-chaperone HscB n=1 Tax=Zavarzinia sp. TaxID=2027920 RepID=UPI00356AA0A5
MSVSVTPPVSCTSCGGQIQDAICGGCKSLQPPGVIDHFARLGLSRTFAIDLAALERAYFQAQRRFHPDRFAGRGAKEKTFSLQHATLINEAYETLRDPLARARYLLDLEGRPLPGGDGRTIADPALLMEAMEWREALEEAAEPAELRALAARVQADTAALEARLGDAFAAHDLGRATNEALRLSYLTKLGAELRRKLLPGQAVP